MAPLTVTALAVGAMLVLLCLSAFFSSSEIAIFTLTDAWVDAQDAERDPRVATLRTLRADPHRLLVTVPVGNNVVNVAIASVTTALLLDYLPTGSAVTVATVIASFVVLLFGEIVPKSYGLGHSETWALSVAGPIAVASLALTPLVLVFDGVSRRLNALLGGESAIEEPYLDG